MGAVKRHCVPVQLPLNQPGGWLPPAAQTELRDHLEGQPGQGGGTRGLNQDGERSAGGGRGGWSTVAAGSRPWGPTANRGPPAPRGEVGGPETFLSRPQREREGGGREDPRLNTARWREEIGQKQISSPLPGVYDIFGLS